jgi:beta-galactosidase
MAGVEVEDYYALQEPVPIVGTWFDGQSSLWAERLLLIGKKAARVIARYGKSNGWLDDQNAITVNGFGNGLVYYVGAYLDELSQQALFTQILKTANVTTIDTAPGVEVGTRVRSGGDEIFYIVINYNSTECRIDMPWPSFDHLNGVPLAAQFHLPAYGVAVFSPSKK